MAALPVQTAGPLSETGAIILGKSRKRLLKLRESGDLACSAGGLVRGGWSEVQPAAGGLARELYGGRAMGAGGGEGKFMVALRCMFGPGRGPVETGRG